MRGSHRGAADNSVIILLAVVAAVLGLILYVIFDASSLELWAVTWLAATVTLVTVIRQQKRDQAFYYWESAAALLTATWELVSGLAHDRGWAPRPASPHRA